MKNIKIRNKTIGIGHPLFFIAEAGVNHNGSLKNAFKLIDIAKNAKADAVKFQTFNTDDIILKTAPKSKYHIRTTGSDESQTWYELLKTQELSFDMHKKIINYCNKKKIIFLSTPYDISSVDLLKELVPAYKIASTDNNNLPLIEYIAKKKKPMFISTAMASMEEIKETVKCVKKYLQNKFVLLQCTGNYPSRLSDTNLRVMKTYKKKFNCLVGYSDHTQEIINPIAATAMEASVYEKHFTIDKKLYGPDHAMSLSPKELKDTISLVRTTELVLGNKNKKVLISEKQNRLKLKKVLLLIKRLKNTILNKKMISIKRPGDGISPRYFNEISKYKILKDINKDTVIKKKDLKKIK